MSMLPGTAPLGAASLLERMSVLSHRRSEASLVRRSLRAGENLWWMGDRAEYVTCVERGLVQVVRSGAGGEISVLGLFGSGDTVGLPAALDGATYPADAVVMSSTAEIVRVAASEVRGAMTTDLVLSTAVQRALLDHTRVMMTKISVVSAGSIAARLATLFVHLAERFGTAGSTEGLTNVGVVLTRATLAGFVDARVETVIRALSTWRASDILRTTDAGFEIDRAALATISLGG
jgi:CRP-like cAMP-binding protein